MYFYEGLIGFLGIIALILGLPALAIWLIIKLVRASQRGELGLTLEELRKSSLGIAIAILVPLFFYFLISSVLPPTRYGDEALTFRLGLSIALGLGAFLLGVLARRVPVVGNGLAAGGFIYVIYVIAANFSSFSPVAKLIVALLGLGATIEMGYWLRFHDLRTGTKQPSLHGIKAFGLGLLAYLFSNLVIIFANSVVAELFGANGGPLIPQFGYSGATNTGSILATYQFVVYLTLAVTFLILGLAIRAVRPVSVGLILTGILSLISAIFTSFTQVGHLAAALTTGVALIFLILLGYSKFSHRNN